MRDWRSQAHVKWECKFHVVILPKYRKKVIYGRLRRNIGAILRELCRHKGVELEAGNWSKSECSYIQVFETFFYVPCNSNKWHRLSQLITSFSHCLDTVFLKIWDNELKLQRKTSKSYLGTVFSYVDKHERGASTVIFATSFLPFAPGVRHHRGLSIWGCPLQVCRAFIQ